MASGSSPLNAAYLVEEFCRESKDLRKPAHIVLLDAKSAFDVVSHPHLMRRLYHAGINNGHWSLLQSLHEDASSVVKVNSRLSDAFPIMQGVRQGGILSTDLYKLYVNPLLNQLSNSGHGGKIGTLSVNSSACADDITVMSHSLCDAELLTNIALNFANEERYLLQYTKTVALTVNPTTRASWSPEDEKNICMGEDRLRNVASATHLGITRTTSIKDNAEVTVSGNIKKARRALYSLLGAGLHGHNGLDHETSITLYKVYVLPVLTYGIEITLPSERLLEKLELFQKKTVKQILSIPSTAADPSVYILSGLLPVLAIHHLKILNFFNNICNQDDQSVERQIFVRQSLVKSESSAAWACHVQPLLFKYNLGSVNDYLDNPLNKPQWKRLVHTNVVKYWVTRIENLADMYPTLRYMNKIYTPGKFHPVLRTSCSSPFEATRLPARLRLLTGTYILQINRSKFNQNNIDTICPLCKVEDETIGHFLLRCASLSSVREPILTDIANVLNCTSVKSFMQNEDMLIQLILDCSMLINDTRQHKYIHNLEYHVRRLIYQLHTERYRLYKLYCTT